MSARSAALECLLLVEREGAYANLVLPQVLRKHRLDTRDAALATELTYGTLRMRGLYDTIIAVAARREPSSLDALVREVLRMGVHQVVSMRIPAHAAVDQAVNLAREAGAARASGLVNAVMRRVVEADADAWLARVAPGSSRRDLSVRFSHPEWVVGELERSLEADGRAGQVRALLEAHNVPAKVTLVARPGLVDRGELAAQVDGEPSHLSPWGVVLPGGDPAAVPAVRAGAAAVQDEGSQLAALALASVPLAGPDVAWLDMCAGPGGKAALLGAIAAERGAKLDALELHPHRARLVEDATRALPAGTVAVHTADATEWEGGPYDRIVLDAPCTGLGALRRRPESRWRRTPEDLAELVGLQGRLLEHASRLVRTGGVVAYVTCSPVVAETRDLVERSSLRVLDAREVLTAGTGVPNAWGTQPTVQLWTHEHATDSMFIALLTRD
jgi:16S rRNA (cytosine967-C5)-methyltransferase